MSEGQFNPMNPEYKKVEDLPTEHQKEFVDVGAKKKLLEASLGGWKGSKQVCDNKWVCYIIITSQTRPEMTLRVYCSVLRMQCEQIPML